MGKLSLIANDIRNWFFIRRTIRRESASSKTPWKTLNLRYNWYGRIYTVISLREEDMGDEEVVKQFKAMEKMRPINEYLASLGFTEIVFPSIENVPNSRSYLVVYSPIMDHFTMRWVRRTLALILVTGLVISVLVKFLL